MRSCPACPRPWRRRRRRGAADLAADGAAAAIRHRRRCDRGLPPIRTGGAGRRSRHDRGLYGTADIPGHGRASLIEHGLPPEPWRFWPRPWATRISVWIRTTVAELAALLAAEGQAASGADPLWAIGANGCRHASRDGGRIVLHPPPPRLFWSAGQGGMMLGFVTVNDIAAPPTGFWPTRPTRLPHKG